MQRTAVSAAPSGSLVDLHTRLIDFTNTVGDLGKAKDVLDALDSVSTTCLPLKVLGAARLPVKANNLAAVQLGKSAFLHDSVPAGWWNEYATLAKSNFAPAIFLARSSLGSFTWTEATKMLEPIGVDRWSVELGLKYGMRDGLTYAVGGRWVVGFWSARDLSRILTHPARVIICAAASLAALRLEQLTAPDANRIGTRPHLMRWTAPHKASRCRRVIVADESPERAVHDKNYHHRARPCKEGVPNPRRRCRGQSRRRPEAQTQGGVGVLRQAGAVSGRHGGLRQCALLGA